MRQFKFRIWDKDKKIFVTDKSLFVPYVGIRISPEGGLYHFNELKTNWVLQQFTGLVDKNGVEIYEGDFINGEIWERGSGCLNGLTPIFKREVFFHNGVYVVRPFTPLNVVSKAMIVDNIFEKN